MAAIRITEITDKGKPLRSSAVCLFFLIKLNWDLSGRQSLMLLHPECVYVYVCEMDVMDVFQPFMFMIGNIKIREKFYIL